MAAIFFSSFCYAQTLKIHNASNCTINYYLSAANASCGSSVSSINYSIAPGGTATYTFATTTWSGTAPSTGYIWQFIKEWNACGPYTWVSPDCSTGANHNVCAVGTPCSGIPLFSCMKVNTACNTCSGIKTKWTDYPTGDVYVQIN